jgi:hypothetical protein
VAIAAAAIVVLVIIVVSDIVSTDAAVTTLAVAILAAAVVTVVIDVPVLLPSPQLLLFSSSKLPSSLQLLRYYKCLQHDCRSNCYCSSGSHTSR